MKIQNTKSLFSHVHSNILDDVTAAAFTKKAGARVGPGDELRLYIDMDGKPAQALLVRSSSECAVAYGETSGFLWGALVEIGGRAVLVGDGDPYVVIDLQDLSFTSERVS